MTVRVKCIFCGKVFEFKGNLLGMVDGNAVMDIEPTEPIEMMCTECENAGAKFEDD